MGEKWMEDVAAAGGFEEHARLKAQEKLLEKMEKIPVEKFENLSDMVQGLERLFDAGGTTNLGILSGITDSITETIQTELDKALAPLKNELIGAINTLLGPLMPYISQSMNWFASVISLGFQGWISLFNGKWEDFERKLEQLFPGMAEWRTNFRVELTEWWVKFTMMLNPAYRDKILAANEAGTAGGVYSGQFDIDPEALADMLSDLELPDFSEEG